jgi:hypothetical protein
MGLMCRSASRRPGLRLGLGVAHELVEALDEAAVPGGLLAPASRFGVSCGRSRYSALTHIS